MASSAINSATKFLVCIALLSLFSSTGCRRNRTANSNSQTSSTVSNATDTEEAKRQAQSLVDQGKELYKNDQDEQAVEAFKQAITRDPNNAEAHLRLGMSYAALDKKPEADEEYKKSIELFKKITQSDQKSSRKHWQSILMTTAPVMRSRMQRKERNESRKARNTQKTCSRSK